MHNWQGGVSRGRCSQQAFWVFQQAGVKKILAEGGVGAVNYLLRTRDLVIPHDYMDFSLRKDVSLTDNYLLIMREPFCSDLRRIIKEQTEKNWPGRVFDLGVYANTEGRHFESPSEIDYMKKAGADIVGQSVCPEVYLAREIGACYAGVYIVVNYAEGVVIPWRHEELADIFYNESISLGRIMIDILRNLDISQNCSCPGMRKETLLTKIYSERKNDDG
jgi:5'-methylthioadenosine phosphorylase